MNLKVALFSISVFLALEGHLLGAGFVLYQHTNNTDGDGDLRVAAGELIWQKSYLVDHVGHHALMHWNGDRNEVPTGTGQEFNGHGHSVHSGYVAYPRGINGIYDIYLWDPNSGVRRLTETETDSQQSDTYNGAVTWREVTDGIRYWHSEHGTITVSTGNDTDPNIIQHGGVVYKSWDGTDNELFYWSGVGGVTTQLTNDGESPTTEVGMDHAGVAWEVSGDIYYFDGTSITRITNDGSGNYSPATYNGQVTWRKNDGTDWEIYVWDGADITQVTNNAADDISPCINAGNVVWLQYEDQGCLEPEASCTREIMYWDGINTVQVTSGSTLATSPGVPYLDDDMVVWVQGDGNDTEIMYGLLDSNGNGVADRDDVDDSVDLDGDGNSDNSQDDFKVIKNKGKKIGFRHAKLDRVIVLDSDSNIYESSNKPNRLPYGLTAFVVDVSNPGDDVYVEVYLESAAPANYKWYKFDELGSGWYDYAASSNLIDDLVSFNQNRTVITLHLKDGDYGDGDNAVNGFIVDPGGLGGATSFDSGTDSGSTGSNSSTGSSSDGCFISCLKYSF